MICVLINMTGTPVGSTESGFMEKPGIEPATPGSQGIALIHYTTGASRGLGGFSNYMGRWCSTKGWCFTWVVCIYSFAKLKKMDFTIACKIQFCFESKPFDFSALQYFSLLFFFSFHLR